MNGSIRIALIIKRVDIGENDAVERAASRDEQGLPSILP
jgi:hypothetical protein